MASTGREILKDHYGADHLSHDEIESLGLRVVTEGGEVVPENEVRGKTFRIENRDEPSGYLVRSTETTGQQTTLCYLQPAS